MVINVNEISEDEGLTIHHLFPEGEPDLKGEAKLRGRASLDVMAERDEDEVSLKGRLGAVVELECGRCLEPFSIPIDQSFELLYIPPAKPGSIPEERVLDVDDLAVAIYHDQVIDLDDLVREQVELELPMARLCRVDCRGLCPECGANLNEAQCACSDNQIDPRWAALKGLKHDN